MTKPEYDWNTYYTLEARFKIDEGPWMVISTHSDEQSAMDKMQRKIKKHGNQAEYRVMQKQEVQVSAPEESPVLDELDYVRCERDKLRDTLVETLIIYLDMHKKLSNSLTEMRDYLTGEDK